MWMKSVVCPLSRLKWSEIGPWSNFSGLWPDLGNCPLSCHRMDGNFASSNLSLVPTLDELIKILQYKKSSSGIINIHLKERNQNNNSGIAKESWIENLKGRVGLYLIVGRSDISFGPGVWP
jgi:hypothetical protein